MLECHFRKVVYDCFSAVQFCGVQWQHLPCFYVFWVKLLAIQAYLFYRKQPIDKRNKKKGVSSTYVFSVNFTEFPRTIFLRTPPVAVSEDEHDENKLQHITFRLKMLSLNDSLEGRIAQWLVTCIQKTKVFQFESGYQL